MLPSYVAASDPRLRPVMSELYTTRDVWLSVHEDLLHIARIKAVTAFLEKRFEADSAFLNSTLNKPVGPGAGVKTRRRIDSDGKTAARK